MRFLSISGVLFLLTLCPAQTISCTGWSSSVQAAATDVGGQTQTHAWPPGPLPSTGSVHVPAADADALLIWQRFPTRFVLIVGLSGTGTGNTASVTAGGDFVLQFAATGNVPAIWRVHISPQVSAGSPVPSIGLDVGADGSLEYPDVAGLGADLQQPAIVTPGQSLLLGLQVAASLPTQTPGFVHFQVVLDLLPDNNLAITQNAFGCAPVPVTCVPTFQNRGITFDVAQQPDLMVVVLGLSTQPFVLPSFQGLPCLVVPEPTFLFEWWWGPFAVGLPASVRPVTFHAQGVLLHPAGLLPTDGFTIVAN